MTRLLLIAHAATAWNAERRYQGWSDVPLSEVGRDQVRRLASRLGDEPLDAVFASDLSRAVKDRRRPARAAPTASPFVSIVDCER